jgi:SagB-type dehydrogenase family enzyme
VGTGEDFQSGTSYAAPDGTEPPALAPAGSAAEAWALPEVGSHDAELFEVLAARRSGRQYSGEVLSGEQLARLCWAAQGVTATVGEHQLRTAPSAGGLYAVDLCVALPGPEPGAGVYRYCPPEHQLVPVLRGDAIAAISDAALKQGFMKRSAAIFVLSAHPDRSVWKYEQRSWRYFYLDAGHIGENIMLAAEGLGLASCGIGAFYDTALNQVLVLDGTSEIPLYMVAVGIPRGG